MTWHDQFREWLAAPLSNGTALTLVAWLTFCGAVSVLLAVLEVHW